MVVHDSSLPFLAGNCTCRLGQHPIKNPIMQWIIGGYCLFFGEVVERSIITHHFFWVYESGYSLFFAFICELTVHYFELRSDICIRFLTIPCKFEQLNTSRVYLFWSWEYICTRVFLIIAHSVSVHAIWILERVRCEGQSGPPFLFIFYSEEHGLGCNRSLTLWSFFLGKNTSPVRLLE